MNQGKIDQMNKEIQKRAIVLTLTIVLTLFRFRSRRPPTFQDSGTGGQDVKSLPVRRTQSSNSERIQVSSSARCFENLLLGLIF